MHLREAAAGPVATPGNSFIPTHHHHEMGDMGKNESGSVYVDEKNPIQHIETVDSLPDPDSHLSEEERRAIDKKLVRKLDMKLIPWLTLLYLTAFLDRTNIGNAKVDGMAKDLKMTDGQYRASLSLFFVSYALFEPFTNILLKLARPRWFLTITIVLWGICMTCMGVVKHPAGMMAARFFLGLCEAGLFPGVNFYLSCWYKRSEFGKRAAIFFSAAALAGSFGGLLAAAIAKMNGIGGRPGWAWIFILEGLVTIVVGFASIWMVHDFPDEATFLSPEDRARVIRRLREDNQASANHEDFHLKYFWSACKDWKMYLYMLIYMGADGALYAFSLFVPTIIKELFGKTISPTRANLLSVPPYALAAIATIAVGFGADSLRRRGIFNVACAFSAIAGFSMLIAPDRPNVKYAGIFLAAMGIYPTIANTIAWASNNLEGTYKRGVAMGFIVGWGNLNGVVSSNIYQAKDAPHFYRGHATCLAYISVLLLGCTLLLMLGLSLENKKRRSGLRDHVLEGKTEEEIAMLGDRRPDFIYTL